MIQSKSVLFIAASLLIVNTSSFSPSSLKKKLVSTRLFEGPPKYDKYDGFLTAEEIGKGSVALHINSDSTSLPVYKPGHVLALEMEDFSGETKDNDGWMRGPYTISRVQMNKDDNNFSFDLVVKVVGKKTEAFASAKPNTPIKFGGQFHVPILDGVCTTVENDDDDETSITATNRVVMISTGVGIGPCVGAIEMALLDESYSKFPPIELYASFKTKEEIIYEEYLNELSTKYSNRFNWKPILTEGEGRISSNDELLKMIFNNVDENTHFHLIGNAEMVQEFKKGILESNIVPKEKITIESYFNHKNPIDDNVVQKITDAVTKYSKNNSDTENNISSIESSSILI